MLRVASIIAAAICCAEPAVSWTHGKAPPTTSPYAVNCPVYDTTETTIGTAVVMSNCVLGVVTNRALYASLTGTVTCGPLSDVALILVAAVSPGTPPIPLGANFSGSVASGVLTVTSMITPPEFIIQTGNTIFDANSGSGIPSSGNNGSTVSITGQLSGATGGVGTYSLSDSSFSVGSEPMWALKFYAPLGGPPNSAQISRGPLEQIACQNGTSQIVTLAGNIPANNFAGSVPILVIALMTSEVIGSGPSQSASLKNAQMTLLTLP